MYHRFLVESCLLTHGIVSVANEEIRSCWPAEAPLAWVDRGELRIGSIDEYLPFRLRGKEVARLNCANLEDALANGRSGSLTASGTMAVCAKLGIPLAVTCGLGGIRSPREEYLCLDLPALRDIPVTLLATACKDVLDIPATFAWFRENGVRILGIGTDRCTGYIFKSTEVAFDGILQEDTLPQPYGRMLLCNPIHEEQRIADIGLLKKGIALALQAEAEGKAYHPAANAAFDRLTEGEASRMQLYSIIENAKLAARLTQDL